MSTLSLRIPDSLHRTLKSAAEQDGVSINQFVSIAVAEKLSALQTFNLIAERASKASHQDFLKAMSMVPAGDVVEGDEIPAGYLRERAKRANPDDLDLLLARVPDVDPDKEDEVPE